MNKFYILIAISAILFTSCKKKNEINYPDSITINGIAQNPEGIEYNTDDNTFLLSSLNASPIIKVNFDGTYSAFTSGEAFPVSTAGLEIDYERNRLLVAGFNGTELFDNDSTTKGASFLRIYNLETGVIEKDINLSYLAPNANAFFANDVAVDNEGNAYVTDWYAGIVYKVDIAGNPSIFWTNTTSIPSGPNGIAFHSDGYLLVSILNVNAMGLYADYGLVKIPVSNSNAAELVTISDSKFTGFDGMVLNSNGNVVGVTNNGSSPGGNMLIELKGSNNWESASVTNAKAITSSTTVALSSDDNQFVIHQDFSNAFAEEWTIEQIKF